MAQAPARKAGKPPITANPAFPWIVALWFAALLGIGSLIVPATLMERASTASGIAALLPMAAPPLGFTAKALVALIGTLLGGAVGFALARKITAPKVAKAAARKPLDPMEDIGDPGIDADAHDDLPAPPAVGRRRSLAIKEEEGPSDFLNVAPLPGVSDLAEEGPHLSFEADQEFAEEAEPEVEADLAEPRQEFRPEVEPMELETEALELEESETLTDDQAVAVHGAQDDAQPERQEFVPVDQAQASVIAVGYSEPVIAPATAKKPLSFSPPSMANEKQGENEKHGEPAFAPEPTFAPEDETGPESEDTVSDKQIFQAPDAPDAPDAAEAQFPAVPPAQDEVTVAAPTSEEQDGEGLVQLVQRLGSTLEKHREWSAEQLCRDAAMTPVVETPEAIADEEPVASEKPVPEEFDPAAAEDAAQAMANFFNAPASAEAPVVDTAEPAAPAEMEPPRQRYESLRGVMANVHIDDDEDEEEDEIADLTASFTLPIGNATTSEPTPRPAFDQPPPSVVEETETDEPASEGEEDEAPETDEAADLPEFASLNPFKRNAEEFVRIEEPEPEEADAEPAVLFPNQEVRKAPATPSPAARSFDPPAGEARSMQQQSERPRPSNDDNDRALREALMNLQRMGK